MGCVSTGRWRRAIAIGSATAAVSVTAFAGVTWTRRPVTATVTAAATRSVRPVIDPGLGADTRTPVIVVALPGRLDHARDAVRRAGGTIGRPLPIVDGFAAHLSASAARALDEESGIVSVTVDRSGRFEQASYDSSTTASNFVKSSGATSAWSAGNSGQGVGVAVLDTGVAAHNDLAGRVVYGPDLSGEGTTIDSYGHGTVMAGVIAGNGADATAAGMNPPYTGMAPKATIVAVKTAGRNGAVDVSTMLQAMHWVASYKDQFNIRVLSLSWGVPSTQNPAYDPVDYAVERLWSLGIVVVVAAGNAGPNTATITKPGDDPLALTVGAYDDKQNTDPADDSVPSWSSRGPTAQGLAKPDIVAPGRYITATRSFGSYVEQTYPKALYAPTYVRGSGTSEATAVAAGAAALLIAARPGLTPDQVKNLLKSTALPMGTFKVSDQGAGRLQLASALTATPDPTFVQVSTATGLGSLDASRGGIYVQTSCRNDGTMNVIQGEIDARCEPWNGAAWTGAAWTGAAWTGAAWTGAAWTGAAWTGAAWTGGTWTGGSWQGAAWTGAAWTGSAWTGAAWTGAAWTGSSWSNTSWAGSAWTSAVYEDTFLTAFWGGRPGPYDHVAGEPSEPLPARAVNVR